MDLIEISLIFQDVYQKGKNRKLLESLILVGAFDTFGKTRATLLQAIDQVLDLNSDVEQDEMLFDLLTPKQSYEEKRNYLINY